MLQCSRSSLIQSPSFNFGQIRPVVAIRCKDGVVMGVEKLIASKMMLSGSNRRIHAVHRHSGMVPFCYRILDAKINFSEVDTAVPSSSGDLSSISETLACYAMEQLKAYTNNLADYRKTEDFMDELACAYMMEKIPVSLSYAQASVLLCIGLQGKDISRIGAFWLWGDSGRLR